MKVDNKMKKALELIHEAQTDCCDSNRKLEILMICDNPEDELEVIAECPNCLSRYTLTPYNLVPMGENEDDMRWLDEEDDFLKAS